MGVSASIIELCPGLACFGQMGRSYSAGAELDSAQFLRTEDDFGVSLKSTLKTDKCPGQILIIKWRSFLHIIWRNLGRTKRPRSGQDWRNAVHAQPRCWDSGAVVNRHAPEQAG